MPVVGHDVDGLDDVRVLEGGADAKLGGDLLLVLPLRLAGALGAELLDGEDVAAVLGARLDEAHGAAGAGAQHPTPLAVLFGEVCMCGIVE